MVYKLRFVNMPFSSIEDKVFKNLAEAKIAAVGTGFDTVVEGFSLDGMLSYMNSHSVINGWSKREI